jgi:hypothetical protein
MAAMALAPLLHLAQQLAGHGRGVASRVASRSGPRLNSIFVGSITATEIVPSIALGLELLHSTVIVVHYVAVPECVKSAIGRSAYLVVWVLNLVCHDVTPTRTDTNQRMSEKPTSLSSRTTCSTVT